MKITNFYKRIMIYKETYLPLTQALGILNQKINKPYVSRSWFFHLWNAGLVQMMLLQSIIYKYGIHILVD